MIPELVPLVFIGRDLSSEHPGLYFQDAASFLAGRRWGETNERATEEEEEEEENEAGHPSEGWFETESEETHSYVFEFEQALEALLACSLRRRQ